MLVTRLATRNEQQTERSPAALKYIPLVSRWSALLAWTQAKRRRQKLLPQARKPFCPA